jgi:hypothetical protein
VADKAPIARRADTDESEAATEQATLQIESHLVDVTVSSQGTTATVLTLGVIGPAATIIVGHLVGLPGWLVAVVCLLQIAAAVICRGK